MARSQLNIKIDPELLQRVKAHATRQGKTVTEFVAETLMEAVAEEKVASIEERLARIEKHLGLDGQTYQLSQTLWPAALESNEELAVSLDPEALQRLVSMAEGVGISLNELTNGILLEAVKELEDAHEG